LNRAACYSGRHFGVVVERNCGRAECRLSRFALFCARATPTSAPNSANASKIDRDRYTTSSHRSLHRKGTTESPPCSPRPPSRRCCGACRFHPNRPARNTTRETAWDQWAQSTDMETSHQTGARYGHMYTQFTAQRTARWVQGSNWMAPGRNGIRERVILIPP
jgi:hypothetical protein